MLADKHTDLFRGKSLDKALPAETRKIDESNETSDPDSSMPSLATITTKQEEGSVTHDAFARQHASSVVKEASRVDADDHNPAPQRTAERDSKASIIRKQRRRQLEALDLEQSNHSTPSIPEMRPYEWASTKPARSRRQGFDRDDQFYPASAKKKSTTQLRLKPQPLQLARAIEGLRKSEHSEASTIGESQLMDSVTWMSDDGILENASKRFAFGESSGNNDNVKPKSSRNSDIDKGLKNAKRKTKTALASIEKIFENDETQVNTVGVEPVGWQRIVESTDRVEDKMYARKTPDKPSPAKSANSDNSSVTDERNSTIHSPNEYEKESKAPAMWLPPSEWQDADATPKKGSRCDQEDTNKKSKKGKEKPKMRKIKESSTKSSPQGKKVSKTKGASAKAKNTKQTFSPDQDESCSETSPFAERPFEKGLFAARPTSSSVDLDDESANSDGTKGSERKRSSSVDKGPPVEVSTEDIDDDDKSTQSVDRHLVRESSHRRLLRKQVADRRESLQTILQATKRQAVPEEDDLLSLKRKLAMSQALVQKLEIEKVEITRQSVLDIARAQMTLLEQRDNRERELEKQLSNMMEERNAAVDECHRLRVFINGTCEMCKSRFDESKQYFMDRYVRNAVLATQEHPKASAFEWVSDNLSTEALDLETNTAFRSARGVENENFSLGGTQSESDAASLKATPLLWLSEKLFQGQGDPEINHPAAREEIPFDSIDVEHGVGKEQQDPSRAIDHTKADTKSNSKKGFFGSLLGEKVADEFASLAMPSNIEHTTEAPTRFSFFGNLRGEEVKEDPIFSGQSLTAIAEEKEQEPKKKKRLGLRDEQVLDDMELLNSLKVLGNELGESEMKTAKNTRCFGLKEEQVYADPLDTAIINAASVSKTVRQAPSTEAKPKSFLRQEMVDVDKHDDQLLALLGQSSTATNPTAGKVLRERGLLSPRESSFKSKANANQLAGSNLSSPFTWKRNRGKSKSKDETAPPKLLGKYRSTSPSPNAGSRPALSLDSDRIQLQGIPPAFSHTECANDSPSHEVQSGRTMSSEEHPWNSEGNNTQAMEPDAALVSGSSETNEDGEVTAELNEIDQVASLVDMENNAWE
ncbi:MAG: hypothetical protein SGILL_003413 [Bacillariaceae sp.]